MAITGGNYWAPHRYRRAAVSVLTPSASPISAQPRPAEREGPARQYAERGR
ncbi:hypothetical protein [Streptomyces nigrescens]|uniref:hypothetical protein n=1 Tax=Streptomyces nigrescens TaxID=1920 RepID=UPI0036FFFD47